MTARTDIERRARIRELQRKVEAALEELADPAYGIVAVVVEVGHPPGGTLNAMVTFNVAEHSVPIALDAARRSALEQLR